MAERQWTDEQRAAILADNDVLLTANAGTVHAPVVRARPDPATSSSRHAERMDHSGNPQPPLARLTQE